MRFSTAVFASAIFSCGAGIATALRGRATQSGGLERTIGAYHNSKESRNSNNIPDTTNLNFIADVVAPVKAMAMVNGKAALQGPNHVVTNIEGYHSGGEARKSAPPQDDTKNLDFVRDVTAPVHVIAMANSKNPNGPHRSLQAGAPECFVLDDGSIACALEDFPADGLLTLLFDCLEGVSVFQCDRCTVVLADDLNSLEAGLPTCDGCLTCGDNLSYDCSNFSPNEPCATRNCNGDCIGSGGNPPTPTPPPPTPPAPTPNPPSQDGPECFVLDDGSIACALEDFPADGLLTLLFDCIDGVSVFQCDRCTVVLADDLDSLEAGLPTCDGCVTCGDSLSYDCANFSDNEPCATTNCNGDCIGTGGNPPTNPSPTPPAPTPSPPPPGTETPTPPTGTGPTPPTGGGFPFPPAGGEGGTSSASSNGVRFLTGFVGATALLFI